MDYARSDLEAARTLMASPDHYPRQVCFLAQQAAEKAIKAALILDQVPFPFTHDLDRLRNLLPEQWRVKGSVSRSCRCDYSGRRSALSG